MTKFRISEPKVEEAASPIAVQISNVSHFPVVRRPPWSSTPHDFPDETGGSMMEINKTIDDCIRLGFNRGAVVALDNESNRGQGKFHAANWGVITGHRRFVGKGESCHHPLSINWLRDATTSVERITDLLLINGSPPEVQLVQNMCEFVTERKKV